MTGLPVTFDDIAAARARLSGITHHTPVLTSRLLDERTGARVHLKAEHLQRTGSFKIRGAYNATSRLPGPVRDRGVVAFSSGNHAQAVARAAALLDTRALIVMPHDAPASKRAATEGYGAEVVTYRRGEQDREEVAHALADERGLALVRPYDDPDVIAGQGTAVDELCDDVDGLDVLVVCVGGGGLISGSAIAARHHSPGCRIIGVEPAAGDDVRRSLAEDRIVTIDVPDTIADGQQTTSPGVHTFAVMRELVDAVELVTDAEIVDAMRWALRHLKQVLEPSGASALAAVLAGRVDVTGQRVGVTLSGGNVDADRFARLLGGP